VQVGTPANVQFAGRVKVRRLMVGKPAGGLSN
jgi:hypothetical protein